MMNYYVTSFAQNDIVHRLFYSAHIACTFFQVVLLAERDHDFFVFNVQAVDLSIASLVVRLVSLAMWSHVFFLPPHGLGVSAKQKIRSGPRGPLAAPPRISLGDGVAPPPRRRRRSSEGSRCRRGSSEGSRRR